MIKLPQCCQILGFHVFSLLGMPAWRATYFAGAVTPEITYLFCVPSCGYWAKIGWRSPFICAGISKRVGQLKCRWVHLMQWWYVYISYKFGGLLSCTSADNCSVTVYNWHRSALGLIHLPSPGGSTFVFRYYLLGGDTAMPGGLYAGLCHAFLVSVVKLLA